MSIHIMYLIQSKTKQVFYNSLEDVYSCYYDADDIIKCFYVNDCMVSE